MIVIVDPSNIPDDIRPIVVINILPDTLKQMTRTEIEPSQLGRIIYGQTEETEGQTQRYVTFGSNSYLANNKIL